MQNTTKNLIILSLTPYFGNSRVKAAIKHNIDLDKLITKPDLFAKTLSLREETIKFLEEKTYETYLTKLSKWLNSDNNHILTLLDDHYPENLKQLSNSPTLLYCSGAINLLNSKQLAIVGARNNSTYGKNVVQKLCKELHNYNLTITSGLAYGIDTLAHKFAIENDLPTIAVVGTGVDIIYPSSNINLYNKILQSNGLIVSEFPLGTTPLRHNFPQRNRIISGLSNGVLIIEAANKSGSLITAQLALEQNKEVFAVPGSIFSTTSDGCNNIIKQGAKLVSSAQDILDEINIQTNETLPRKEDNIDLNLDENEKLVLSYIDYKITTIDNIILKSNLSYTEVTSTIFDLELKSLIESIPGGYIKTH